MSKSQLFIILGFTAAISGCGTVMNFASSTGDMPPKPFGGVAHDLEAVAKGDPLGIIDIPGSFVGDILTLPEALIATDIDRNRVKSTPGRRRNDVDDQPKSASKSKRVYTYVPAEEKPVATAEPAESDAAPQE